MLDIKASEYFNYHIEYYFYTNSCIFCISKKVASGQYRGEDSGAIYNEYDYLLLERYDISSLLDTKVDINSSKTLREILNYRDYFGYKILPYDLYKILKLIPNIDNYRTD